MSAVLVASGGVVATLAVPAQAATDATTLASTAGDRPAATAAAAGSAVDAGQAARSESAFSAGPGRQGVGAGAGTVTRAAKRQVAELIGTAAMLPAVADRAAGAASLETARPAAAKAPAVSAQAVPVQSVPVQSVPVPSVAGQSSPTLAPATSVSQQSKPSPATMWGTVAASARPADVPSATAVAQAPGAVTVSKVTNGSVATTATTADRAPAADLSADSVTQALTRTVEFAGQRSQVVSAQTLAKRLDRTGVRARTAAAGVALNTSFPALTRAVTRTARNQASTLQLGGTARGSAALSIASGLTGIWYRWGGASPSGFDCSGYTSYVYRKMGVRLPRTAAAQQAYTKRVRTPRPGDLVFFGAPAHHVGIYAGGGMMYDAPSRGRKTQLRKVYTSRVTYGRIG